MWFANNLCVYLLTNNCVKLSESSVGHRRTKSAPSASFFRSPKSLFRLENDPDLPQSKTSPGNDSHANGAQVAEFDSSAASSDCFQSEKKTPRAERFENIKNSLRESLKVDTPFKLFRSKTNAGTVKKNNSSNELYENKRDNAESVPVFTISDDFIEVTLDEPDDVTSTSSDLRSQDSVMFKGDNWGLTASFDSETGPSSDKVNFLFFITMLNKKR